MKSKISLIASLLLTCSGFAQTNAEAEAGQLNAPAAKIQAN